MKVEHILHLVEGSDICFIWSSFGWQVRGLAVRKSRRFIGASDKRSLWLWVHRHPSFILPRLFFIKAPHSWTYGDFWWIWVEIIGAKFPIPKTGTRGNVYLINCHIKTSFLFISPSSTTTSSSLMLQLFKVNATDSRALVYNKALVRFTTSRGVSLH